MGDQGIYFSGEEHLRYHEKLKRHPVQAFEEPMFAKGTDPVLKRNGAEEVQLILLASLSVAKYEDLQCSSFFRLFIEGHYLAMLQNGG